MTEAEKMAEAECLKWVTSGGPSHLSLTAAFESGAIAGWNARGGRDAAIAFEHIRCDDRTDRWLVANVVAGHIRKLDEEES